MKYVILIPIYNDRKSLKKLVENINSEIKDLNHEISIVVINDASSQQIIDTYPNIEGISSFELINMKEKLIFCSKCHGISESEVCHICNDERRNMRSLCVVESPADIYTFEKTSAFRGLYHVLGGVLSPLDGIGPDELNIAPLLQRITPDVEVLIATNATIEGEATCLYLANILEKKSVRVTRLARGLPMGGDLEFVDEATIMRAIEDRTEI